MKWHQMEPGRFFPTNPDLADMLGNSEFHFEIGGWGAELNREIVSCRACVRAVCMSSEFGVKIYGPGLSLFPFGPGRFSLFPSPRPPISYPASAGFIGI